MTDAELIAKAYAVLLACLKGDLSEEETVIALIGLYEDAGRPFIADVEVITPANDWGPERKKPGLAVKRDRAKVRRREERRWVAASRSSSGELTPPVVQESWLTESARVDAFEAHG